MIKARFVVKADDFRPIKWPIQHPYWWTGTRLDDDAAILVAYADSVEQIKELWPDAEEIDVFEYECNGYSFSERLPRPKWTGDAVYDGGVG